VSAGDYDIVYLNPYQYTVFHQSRGYKALVREKDRKIKGIIVVRKHSAYRDIAELEGQPIAFPAATAFAASVLPRAYMNHLGISHKPAYVSFHNSVYLAVAKDIYPAGGGVVGTFNKLDPEIHEQLRILWETPGFTPHPIAVHPRVDKKTVRILRDAMIKMDRDPKGAELLKAMGFNGLLAAHDADYDDTRALNITRPQKQNFLKK
jgi:phosphonate transport system substrate-binding protein